MKIPRRERAQAKREEERGPPACVRRRSAAAAGCAPRPVPSTPAPPRKKKPVMLGDTALPARQAAANQRAACRRRDAQRRVGGGGGGGVKYAVSWGEGRSHWPWRWRDYAKSAREQHRLLIHLLGVPSKSSNFRAGREGGSTPRRRSPIARARCDAAEGRTAHRTLQRSGAPPQGTPPPLSPGHVGHTTRLPAVMRSTRLWSGDVNAASHAAQPPPHNAVTPKLPAFSVM